MDTTKLIVEYLVAGTLMLVSTLFAMTSWFPNDVKRILTSSAQQQTTFANPVIFATIFIALAYGIGIVSEYIAEQIFEGLLDNTKKKRMSEYVSTHETIMKDSPILGSFAKQPKEKRNLDDLASCVGKMRFFVMNHSALLYADIAAQISRFRLIRVLFLAEAIAFIAIIGQVRYGLTLFWFVAFALIIFITSANYMAVRSRFNRYCRAVERSYMVLMFERAKSQSHKIHK